MSVYLIGFISTAFGIFFLFCVIVVFALCLTAGMFNEDDEYKRKD